MHPIRWIVTSVLLLPLAACQPPQDIEKEIEALKELDSQFVNAFEAENLESLMALYWNSPDLVLYWPRTMEVRGYEATQLYIEQFFESNEVRSLELLDSQHKVSGDLAVGWGKYKIAFRPTEGPEIEAEGRYTLMMVKEDGEWLIAVDHASAPLPPLPAEGMEAAKK